MINVNWLSDFRKKKDWQKKLQVSGRSVVVHQLIDEKFPFPVNSIEKKKRNMKCMKRLRPSVTYSVYPTFANLMFKNH